MPDSGWPIDAATLAPYYERAHRLWGTRFVPADVAHWQTEDRKAFAFADDALESKVLAIGRRAVFTREIRAVLERVPRMKVLLRSNAVELICDANGRSVTAVEVACLNGHRFRVQARQVVLAQGAYQVPRLLLASRSGGSAGLGNAHDLVGRYLTDRQVVRTGSIALRRPLSDFGFYDLRLAGDALVIGKLGLSARTQAREGLLNATIGLVARPFDVRADLAERLFGRGTTARSPGMRAGKALLAALRRRRWPEHAFADAGRLLRHLDDIAFMKLARPMQARNPVNCDSGGWFTVPDRERRFRTMDAFQLCEQSPDRENRVMLDMDRRDATGMPLLKLQFRWNAIDIRSAIRTQDLVAAAFEQAGIGRVRIERRDGVPLIRQISTHHPAGTARMADDPKRGVVDAHCRVHGVSNLHVASSAAFPTGASIPPTLTIIALSLRVGDSVRAALAAPVIDVRDDTVRRVDATARLSE